MSLAGRGFPRADRGRIRRPAVVIALLALGTASAGAPAGVSPELHVALPRLPAGLDPATVGGSADLMVFRQLFQGLVELGDRGDVEPGLATQWNVSRDGLIWTFRLRADVQFHNGAPLTPDLVVASLSRHLHGDESLNREPPRPWARVFRGPAPLVREVRRGQPGTVQIHLTRPFSPLLGVLAHPALAIAVPQNDSQVPFLGTGPYRVVERATGRLVLQAAPAPWSPAPRVERLVFREVADEGGAAAEVGPPDLPQIRFAEDPPVVGPGFQVLTAPTWQMGFLALRTDGHLLARKAVRQAILAALDPGALQAALESRAVPWRAYLPPGAWAAREPPPPPHDPARAQSLMSQSGVAASVLTLLVPEGESGPDAQRLGEAIRLSLASAGVKVEVRGESGEAYVRALRQGDADMVLFETALEVNDPHFGLHPLVASEAAVPGSATNVAFFRSPVVDGMLLRASQLGFRPERLRLYQRLQAHLADELPYIPLYVRQQWAVSSPAVRDLRLDPGGRHRLDRVWVEVPSEPAPGPTPPLSPLPPPPIPAPVLTAPPAPAGSPQ